MCSSQDTYQVKNEGSYSIEDSCCTYCGENLVAIFFSLEDEDVEIELN